MHVLYLCEVFHPNIIGGAGRIAGDLAIALAQQGLRVSVICPVPEAQAGVHQLQPNLTLVHLPVTDGRPPEIDQRQHLFQMVTRAIDLASVDIFHNNGGFFKELAEFEQELMAHMPQAVFIAQFQIQWRPLLSLEGLPQAVIQPLVDQQRRLVATAATTIFISRAEQQEGFNSLGAIPEKSLILPNAIPAKRFENLTDGPIQCRGTGPIIALGGRLNARMKGLGLGLEALTILADTLAFRVLLIGDAPPEQQIPNRLRDRTTATGWLSGGAYAATLASADLLLMPSVYEPFGILAAEAGALGLPVVAFDHQGPADIVVHELTGLLVPPENPLPPLAEAIRRLITDAGLRGRMGAAARTWVHQHFLLEALADRMVRLYQDQLAQPHVTHGKRRSSCAG